MTNSDGTLLLNAPDGRLIINTTLKDLIVTGTSGTQLEMGSTGITLDNVTLELPAIVKNNQTMTIINGLTVNDTLTVGSTGFVTDLAFNGTQTVGGTGTILLGGTPDGDGDNRLFASGTDAVLTIEDGLTVTGRGVVYGVNTGSMINLKGNLTPGPNPEDIIGLSNVTNSDGTLLLNAPDGRLIINTTLKDLIVTGTSGTQLEMGSTGITLDNVTLELPAIVKNNQTMTITNGLTVNDTLTVGSTGFVTDLAFNGTQTVGGTGTILLGGTPDGDGDNRLFASGTDAVLTIEDGLTVTGRGVVYGVNTGSMINLKGNLTPGPNPEDIIGLSNVTNSDGTLLLNAPDGRLIINTTLKDLIVTGTSGTQLEMGSTGITLDNVTLELPAIVKNNQTMTIINGLTVNDTLTVGSTGFVTDLAFNGTQTVGGTGTILLGGTPDDDGDNRLFASGTGAVLTIADGLTVRGRGRLFGANTGSAIIVEGALRADLGQTLTLGTVDVSVGTVIVELDAIGGEPNGRLTGSGEFALPSTLQIERPTDFVPTVGDEFEIFDFASFTDAIDEILGDEIEGVRLASMIDAGTLKLLADNL